MANFDNSATQARSVQKANGVLANIHHVYEAMKVVQALMALYQAGTEPTFNTAINTLFSASERNELVQMNAGIATLVTDWETNHAGALQQ